MRTASSNLTLRISRRCSLCSLSSHHTLVRVGGLVGCVQQLAVLQLLTKPLQGVEWLVQLDRHRHFGQVLPNVVPEDVPQTHAAGGTGSGQPGATTNHRADATHCRGGRRWMIRLSKKNFKVKCGFHVPESCLSLPPPLLQVSTEMLSLTSLMYESSSESW